jgi:hypothetical protein
MVNRLESTLQVLLIAGTLAFSIREQRRLRPVALGVLSGLTVLARLDAAFFAVALAAMPLFWPAPADRDRPFASRLVEASLAGALLVATVAPYFLYNRIVFHHWLPVSGAIKAGAAVARGPLVRWGVPIGCALALAAVVAVRPRAGDLARRLFPLAACVALETAYNANLRGLVVPEVWYLAPHLLLLILVVGHLVRRCAALPARRAFTVAALAFVVATVASWRFRLDPASYSAYVGARRAGEWLRRSTAPDALVAGWDCGIAAAHSRRRFMNLDGLINSWDFKERFLDRGRTYRFITEEHPADYVHQYVILGRFDGRHVRGVDFSGRGWNVVYQDAVAFRSILEPRRERVDVFLVLTRKPGGTPFDELGPSLATGSRPSEKTRAP